MTRRILLVALTIFFTAQPLRMAEGVAPTAAGARLSLQLEMAAAAKQDQVPGTTFPAKTEWATNMDAHFSYNGTKSGSCMQPVATVSFPLAKCTFGEKSSHRALYLLGDSQADQWLPALDVWGIHKHWKVVVLTKASCRPWPSSRYMYWDYKSDYPTCPQFNRWAIDQVNSNHPDIVLMTAQLGMLSPTTMETSSDVVSSIRRLKVMLQPSKARLILMQNIPWFWGPPASPACLAAHLTNATSCAQPRVAGQGQFAVINQAMATAIKQLADQRIAPTLNVDDLVCSPTTCPMISISILLYKDMAHLTREWVQHVAPAFDELLTPLASPGH